MTNTLETQTKKFNSLILVKNSFVKQEKLRKAQVEMAKKPQT